jgi:hypothetical protein
MCWTVGYLLVADFVQKSLCRLIDGTTDRISFGVAGTPGEAPHPTRARGNHFLPSIARTSSRILLQHNLGQCRQRFDIAEAGSGWPPLTHSCPHVRAAIALQQLLKRTVRDHLVL